ncbi:alpha/beta fold hydrolase [Xanthobacter sp. KR7-65]|uniref:alpha/beta hydrolase n=1 Tax=Xanthobacter sp. KR7-65 TaxID=3156612 RepID=UPI0032B39F51
MDHEVEYNNRARVPDHPAIFERWAHSSAAMRGAAVAADLGAPYGAGPRQILDIVWPSTDRQAPVVLFIHGGYFQSLHPRDFTFAAQGCLEHGVAMAFAGYDLAPMVPVGTILAQARAAAITLYRLVGRRLVVCGHSAGGHLAAALAATSWREIDVDTPDDLIVAGLGISGVYELEPLVSTTMNKALKLDAAEALRLSPTLWPLPPGRSFDAFVGGAESAEFLRQSRDLAASWSEKGAIAHYFDVPGADHFTVVDALADPTSHMVRRLVEMARAIAV